MGRRSRTDDLGVDRVAEAHRQREAHVVESEPGQDAVAEDPATRRQPEGEGEGQRPVGDALAELGRCGVLGVDVQGHPVAGEPGPVTTCVSVTVIDSVR